MRIIVNKKKKKEKERKPGIENISNKIMYKKAKKSCLYN